MTVFGMLALMPHAGCTVGREFREVAVPGLQIGVSAIANALVDGFFAAIEVDSVADESGVAGANQ